MTPVCISSPASWSAFVAYTNWRSVPPTASMQINFRTFNLAESISVAHGRTRRFENVFVFVSQFHRASQKRFGSRYRTRQALDCYVSEDVVFTHVARDSFILARQPW